MEFYNMDCMEGMKSLPSESVDCIITDPPYNISVENNFHTMKGRAGIDFGEWDKGFNLTSWIAPALGTLKNGGNIVIFNAWRNMGEIAQCLEDNGCLIKEMLQWKKSNPMPRNRDRLYVTSCEFAIWATKGKGWTYNRQRNTYENTVFEYPIVSPKQRMHRTQKPVELMKDLIKIHSNIGDTILDPFMGSGTTALACIKSNRNFIGFEIDKDYYKTASRRLEAEKITSKFIWGDMT